MKNFFAKIIFLAILCRISFAYEILAASSVPNSISRYCQVYSTQPICDPNSPYRTFDGSCNNLNNTLWGVAHSQLQNFLPKTYGDGLGSPTRATDGSELPNPRTLSYNLFPVRQVAEKEYNVLFVHFGQFLAEDSGFNTDTGGIGRCCSDDGKLVNLNDPACLPIKVPEDDPHFTVSKRECINFIRTTTDVTAGCPLSAGKPANQLNIITSYLDLSGVYAGNNQLAASLRAFSNGRLKVAQRNGRDWLPPATVNRCFLDKPDDICYQTGDPRSNINPQGAVQHTLFLREHNRIAAILQQLNPHWDDERLFQETRRINIAQYQYIVYYQWLPSIIGRDRMRKNGLYFYQSGTKHVDDYNPTVNPTIYSEHSTGSGRVMHNMISDAIKMYNEAGISDREVPLGDFFFRPKIVEQDNNFDPIARGMIYQAAQASDRYFGNVTQNKLFRRFAEFGDDLKAIDIMRNREHGLARYNDLRVFCGLKRAESWDDYADVIPKEDIDRMKLYYNSFEDVDMNVGASLERNLDDSITGHTFNCIQIIQYRNLRQGDRFFFENDNESTRFTKKQLKEIRRASLSRIICDNANDINQMPKKSFEIAGIRNPPLPCEAIQGFSLEPWRESVNQ